MLQDIPRKKILDDFLNDKSKTLFDRAEIFTSLF